MWLPSRYTLPLEEELAAGAGIAPSVYLAYSLKRAWTEATAELFFILQRRHLATRLAVGRCSPEVHGSIQLSAGTAVFVSGRAFRQGNSSRGFFRRSENDIDRARSGSRKREEMQLSGSEKSLRSTPLRRLPRAGEMRDQAVNTFRKLHNFACSL